MKVYRLTIRLNYIDIEIYREYLSRSRYALRFSDSPIQCRIRRSHRIMLLSTANQRCQKQDANEDYVLDHDKRSFYEFQAVLLRSV